MLFDTLINDRISDLMADGHFANYMADTLNWFHADSATYGIVLSYRTRANMAYSAASALVSVRSETARIDDYVARVADYMGVSAWYVEPDDETLQAVGIPDHLFLDVSLRFPL